MTTQRQTHYFLSFLNIPARFWYFPKYTQPGAVQNTMIKREEDNTHFRCHYRYRFDKQYKFQGSFFIARWKRLLFIYLMAFGMPATRLAVCALLICQLCFSAGQNRMSKRKHFGMVLSMNFTAQKYVLRTREKNNIRDGQQMEAQHRFDNQPPRGRKMPMDSTDDDSKLWHYIQLNDLNRNEHDASTRTQRQAKAQPSSCSTSANGSETSKKSEDNDRANCGPKRMGRPDSDGGVNENAYNMFVFNEIFQNISYSSTQRASEAIYKEHSTEFYNLMRKANNSMLTKDDLSKWSPVATALVQAFTKERGVVTFSNNGTFPGWYLCGWVDLQHTFVAQGGFIRMCATLRSVGMDDISRPPLPGLDYADPNLVNPSTEHRLRLWLQSLINAYGLDATNTPLQHMMRLTKARRALHRIRTATTTSTRTSNTGTTGTSSDRHESLALSQDQNKLVINLSGSGSCKYQHTQSCLKIFVDFQHTLYSWWSYPNLLLYHPHSHIVFIFKYYGLVQVGGCVILSVVVLYIRTAASVNKTAGPAFLD